MIKKVAKSPLKISLVIILTGLVFFLGFLIYDSKEPFVKPLFTKQINSSCPYYKDFLGRVFYRYSYYPSSLFIIGPIEKKVQYNWHKVKGVDSKNFRIERILPESEIVLTSEMQKTCLASDGNNVIYNNYVFANADVETFEILENFFFRDKNVVYFSNGRIIPEADPQTFKVLTTNKCPELRFAKDKYRFYDHENIVGQEEVDSFERNCIE